MIDTPPEWRVEPGYLPYPDAIAAMEARVAAIREGTAPELVWLVEHPPLYTAGTSAQPSPCDTMDTTLSQWRNSNRISGENPASAHRARMRSW